jgi:hypothetical protein
MNNASQYGRDRHGWCIYDPGFFSLAERRALCRLRNWACSPDGWLSGAALVVLVNLVAFFFKHS